MSNEKTEANDRETPLSAKLPENKWQLIIAINKLLSKLPLSVQLFLALIGLIVASYFGWRLRQTLFDNQENMARTLGATIVSTAYPHRGVTAFLVAELDKDLPPDSAKNDKLNAAVDAIQSDIDKLRNFVAKSPQKFEPAVKPRGKGAAKHPTADEDPDSFDPHAVFKSLNLMVFDKQIANPLAKNATWKKAVISQEMKVKGAYLMVPAISLRQRQVGSNLLENDKLEEVFQNNPEVLFDFHVARRIDDKLMALRNMEGQPLKIVQAYFISESGTILLRGLNDNISDESTFPTNTLFMDRLYFWGAIDPDSFRTEKNEGPLDYQTGPYIDLGGNGVVKTYSRRVELPNHRSGVICVDVELPDASVKIKERLEALGARVDEGSYAAGADRLKASDGGPTPKGFEWVNAQLGSQARSRITGAVAFQSDFVGAPKDDVVRFTIPVGNELLANRTPVTKLLLVTFDFTGIKYWILGYTIGFVAGILLLVFVLLNLFWHYNFLKEEMNEVLEKMYKVMSEAETPFVWLNGENQFHKVNKSFLDKVGCNNDTELKLYAPTFRDLVTAETQPIYEAILEKSTRGEPTPKYRIDIIKQNREVIQVWVHGESIPYPTLGRRLPPHRFGVLLPPPEATEVKRHEGGTGEDSSGAAPPKYN